MGGRGAGVVTVGANEKLAAAMHGLPDEGMTKREALQRVAELEALICEAIPYFERDMVDGGSRRGLHILKTADTKAALREVRAHMVEVVSERYVYDPETRRRLSVFVGEIREGSHD